MKHFVLIPNEQKSDAVVSAQEIRDYIMSQGGTACVLSDADADTEELKKQVPADTEAILTLGGDGTILQAVHHFAALNIPFLGINLGTLGFLAEIEKENMKLAVDRLLKDEYFTEPRMMLSGSVLRDGHEICSGEGLNDIVLHSAGLTRAMTFELSVNGEHLKTYFADGIILATPTGSTAYNLSAGGPIAMPSGEIILSTLINPHTLMARSIVLPDNVTVSVRMCGKPEERAAVSFDSDTFGDLRYGDEILVKKSDLKIRILKLKKDSFIEVLRNKLEISL